MRANYQRFLHLENHIHHLLVLHSITALRIALGTVFLGFGLLKYFPGVSPAEDLATATTDILLFGLVPGSLALIGIATLECFIGICLLTGRLMRLAIWLLAIQFVGILAPAVVLFGRLFDGPGGAPTLEGQYVLKDVILVAAGLVIAAASFRGGRMVREDLPPLAEARAEDAPSAEQKLRIVLDGMSDQTLVAELCDRHQVTESEFHAWRATTLEGATEALARAENP